MLECKVPEEAIVNRVPEGLLIEAVLKPPCMALDRRP
jgi:hypothetical protein